MPRRAAPPAGLILAVISITSAARGTRTQACATSQDQFPHRWQHRLRRLRLHIVTGRLAHGRPLRQGRSPEHLAGPALHASAIPYSSQTRRLEAVIVWSFERQTICIQISLATTIYIGGSEITWHDRCRSCGRAIRQTLRKPKSVLS